MESVELSETICLAQEGNRCATELLYIRYKPFVESAVCRRKLVERANDVSVDKEDVVQDILPEAISTGISNFNIEKFMNSKKKDVDSYFQRSINFTINKWLTSHFAWKYIPHYRDTFTGSLDHIKTFRFSLITYELQNCEVTTGYSYIPGTYEANNIDKLTYEDNTYEYKVLKELVVEKAIYLLDKFFSKRTIYKGLDKHKIVSLLEMKFSGHYWKVIAEEIGILLIDLVSFYRKVIKPAVLLAFDEACYYKHYMSSLCSRSLGTMRKEKGKEFVDNCLSMV